TASRVTEQKIRTMTVICDGAYIEMDYIDRRLTVSRDTRVHYENNGKTISTLENVGERIYVPAEDPLLARPNHCRECVRPGRRPTVSRVNRVPFGNNGKANRTLGNGGGRLYVPDEEPLLAQTQHFLECVRTGRPPLVGVEDGLSALEVVERVQAQVYQEAAP